MIRLGYAKASVLVLDAGEEYFAAVTLDNGRLAIRRTDSLDVDTVDVLHAWQDGQRTHVVTAEWGELTIRRVGGCGCRG